jgi:hypothetical protein
MAENERLEVLYEIYTHLINTDFKPDTVEEEFAMESIVSGYENRTRVLYVNPLMVYRSLLFSHNFLYHIWKDEYMQHGKEMLEAYDPIMYVKENLNIELMKAL